MGNVNPNNNDKEKKMTEFQKAIQHYAKKTKPGTYAHLFVMRNGKMSVEYDKTEKQNNDARFFCKFTVKAAEESGIQPNISAHVSISSDGFHEVLYPLPENQQQQ